MKKIINNTVSLLKNYDILNLSKHSRVQIILLILSIIGMISGAITVPTLNIDLLNNLDFIFLTDFSERMQQTNLQVFISSFSALSFFALLIELSAFSCLGVIIIPIITTFRALGLGITAGYLYLIHGLKGIAFYILILLPGIFISSLGLILFSSEGINFSSKILKNILPKGNEEKLWDSLKYHLKKVGYSLMILCISSLADVCFMMMFSRFFNF